MLTGTDLTLYFANRLQAYLYYHSHLPFSLTSKNLREDLVKMYALVLRFLASAIQIYRKNAASRMLEALWKASNLENFEDQCNKLSSRVQAAASVCDRELSEHSREDAKRWRDDLDQKLQSLDDLHSIKGSLDVLQDKVDLTRLVVVKNAIYDSYADENSPRCLEGTRMDLRFRITRWVDAQDSKLIFWLCGKAGTGKSTVSRTVAHLQKQRRLVASFFFKRGEVDRGNAGLFFPTIARQLADSIPGLGHAIADALAKDSFLCERNLQEQFEKLVFQPLLNLEQRHLPPRVLS